MPKKTTKKVTPNDQRQTATPDRKTKPAKSTGTSSNGPSTEDTGRTRSVSRKTKPISSTKDLPSTTSKRAISSTDLTTGEPTIVAPLSEITGGREFSDNPNTISISNPVPRIGPYTANTDLERLLNIKWNDYIPQKPTRKQIAAMMLAHVKELMFGGALGGGKSSWLAMEALRYCDLPSFSAIIFRRQLTDLKQPGGLIPRIASWLAPHVEQGKCRYAADEHTWFFKTKYPGTDIPGPDARLQFGYIGEASIRDRYSSAEYQLVEFEELWQWPDDVDYLFMRTRIRKVVCSIHGKHSDGTPNYAKDCPYCQTLAAIPLRVRSATNPGPAWIKRRFGIIPDPTQFPNRHAALVAISEGLKVRWVGTVPHRPFIPSYLEDNQHLDANDYRAMLSEISEEERSRLEDGNWEARRNARFKRRWQRFYHLNVPPDLLASETPMLNTDGTDRVFDMRQYSYSYVDTDIAGNTVVHDPVSIASLRKIFTTTDPAVTVRQGPVDEQVKQKRSSAVISTWGVTQDNYLLWLNFKKFRKEIPDLVEQLVNTNIIWQPQVNKIECNGVGIGVAQYTEAAGLPVSKNYRKTDKLENSISAQIMMKNGRILFPSNALWVEEAEDDVFNWTGLPAEDDDTIDTLSDAATEMAPGLAHVMSAPTLIRSRPRAISMAIAHQLTVPHYGISQTTQNMFHTHRVRDNQ
jgi:phage terminase large subunit-like protein